tara:strand:+ start:544 stop:780 length:237 start_codon:yes stop_codon:yes gene_type:complete
MNSKPLKFALENEELILRTLNEIKTAVQENNKIEGHMVEIMHETLHTHADIASAMIFLAEQFAEKFPTITDEDINRSN